MTGPDAIERYISTLAGRLRGPVIDTHRALLEAEDHLRQAAAESIAHGMDEESAQRAAIDKFGSPEQIAQGLNRVSVVFAPIATVRALLVAAWQLIAIGLVVVGVSAAVALIASLLTSSNAVFGLPTNAVSGMKSCAHWLAVQPAATSCQEAGTLEARDDMTLLLGGLGVVGLVLLVIAWVARRFGGFSMKAIPPTLVPAISTAMFSVAALGLFALGQSNAVVEQAWGQGMWYSQSVSSFVAALVSAFLLVRVIRRPFAVTVA